MGRRLQFPSRDRNWVGYRKQKRIQVATQAEYRRKTKHLLKGVWERIRSIE